MALFDRLTGRLERRAAAIAERTRVAVDAAWTQFPDIIVRRDGDLIDLSGRGLMRRWMSDMRLRFAPWSK